MATPFFAAFGRPIGSCGILVHIGFKLYHACVPANLATTQSINPSPSGRGLGEGQIRVLTSTLTRRCAAPSPNGRGIALNRVLASNLIYFPGTARLICLTQVII